MLPGEVIVERFVLEGLASAGGMGTVWRALDRMSGEIVAIKLLRDPGGGHDERFLREAALLADLHHPAVVRHLAHGRTVHGELYMAMEWLEGEDLSSRLRRGPLPASDAIALIRRVADGLAGLHARGGVHRDLKPANLFLEGGLPERVKVLDFGIARAAAASALTSTGTMLGTPGYTAPEQVRGAREVDARADVFALGCVLFECLTGRAPFRGDHVMAVLARILLEDAPRLFDLAPGAPAVLEGLIARLLHKDPLRRPRDAAELRDLLDAMTASETVLRISGPLTPRPPTLGSDEQRFMCLVLATVPDHAPDVGGAPTLTPRPSADGIDPTLLPDARPSPQHLAALVRSHGARLETLADGSWVALADRGAAGAPATDQAVQAARVALALAQAIPQARVAVASGRGVHAGRAPVGEVIDQAIALCRAPPGGVVVDRLTAGLLSGTFELRDDRGWLRLVVEHADAERERKVLGRSTPYVGREREMATLLGLFDECIDEPCARAVLVKGPAGQGKSRLRAELLARLRARGVAFEWLYGRGEPLHAGAPFAIAAQLVRRAAGIVEGEPLEVRRARLAARVAAVVPAVDRDRVVSFLGELAHVPADEHDAVVAAARRDAMVMGDQMRRAWDDWLIAETERRPVVLVLEDVQLGDLSSLKLVDSSLRNLRERPLLVLALGRPDVDRLFPGLWAERGVVTMALPELSRRAATRLVHEVLGEIDDPTVARIIDQAAGNAFYLEELCRVMHGGGGGAGELPGTVLAMVQARLEAIDVESRRLLRAGSVFGQSFPRGGVLALSGDPEGGVADRMLGDLVERELIEPGPAEFRGEPTFAFRHALVREAAYATLTNTDRQLGHRLAAAWLTEAGTTDPVLLAEHWERGGHPERAVDGYLAAARHSLEGNDLPAVLARVERGLTCGARGAALGDLLVLRAEAHRWRADYSAANEAATLAMAALPDGSRAWCQAALQAMASMMAGGHHDRLDDILRRVVAAPPLDQDERLRTIAKGAVNFYLAGRYDRADELLATVDAEVARAPVDDALLEARVHEARAFREGARAEQGRALALLEAAAAAYARAGDLRSLAMCRNNLGYTYSQLGDYHRAVALLDETLRDSERMGLPYVATVVAQNLGFALAHAGLRDRSETILRASLDAFRAQHDIHMAACGHTYLSILHLAAGAFDAAEAEAQAAVTTELSSNLPAKALALACLARARVARGDATNAVAPAREAYGIVQSLGGLDEGEMLVRLALVEVLDATDRRDEARAVARVATARIDLLADRLAEPWRSTFLTAVPENAALRAFAARL